MICVYEEFPVGSGRFEKVDPKPKELLTGIRITRTLEDQIQTILNMKLNSVSPDIEPETLEESVDFGDESELAESERAFYNLPDDDKSHSQYWNVKDVDVTPDNVVEAQVISPSAMTEGDQKGEVAPKTLVNSSATDTSPIDAKKTESQTA